MTVPVVAAAAAWAMVGVIRVLQVVHSPLPGRLSEQEPAPAAQDHQRRITRIVGPLMTAEGVTALILLVDRPATMSFASAAVVPATAP